MTNVQRVELAPALSEGFAQAIAEKVIRLLGILREVQEFRGSTGMFTLKGGTALNIFHFPRVPRLSVDIDLMATGFPTAEAGTSAHTQVVELVTRLVSGMGYRITTSDGDAGSTVFCQYRNSLGAEDRLKIDIDLLNRQTLLPAEMLHGPSLFNSDDFRFPVASRAELLGQKLVAVAYRGQPRDLFDMFAMLNDEWDVLDRARQMYLAYSFLKDHEWYRLDYPVRLNVAYREDQLRDVLRGLDNPPSLLEIRRAALKSLRRTSSDFTFATPLEQACRKRLLSGDRLAFSDIAGETDPTRRLAIAAHPGVSWRLLQAQGG